MSFLETVAKAKAYLREHARVSLQGLRREFDLDETAVDELIEELVDVQQVAAREGKVLSWIGAVPPRPKPPNRSPRRGRSPKPRLNQPRHHGPPRPSVANSR